MDGLRRTVRQPQRAAEPTAGAIDTQLVQTGGKKGGCHGDDTGKQITGRKRHVLVNTEGLLLAVQGQAASVQDPGGAGAVLAEAKSRAPDLHLVWGDGRYQGPLVAQAACAVGLRVEVVRKPSGTTGFTVLPRRDYETNPRNSEPWIKVCLNCR